MDENDATPPLPPPAAPPPPPSSGRRLTRSRDDRLIAGVCGGLGRYFDVDPVIFRVAFVALLLLGGSSLLVYAAAWLLLPEDGASRSIGESWLHHGPHRGNWLPIALIVIGAIVLSNRLSHDHGGAIVFGVAAIVLGAYLMRPRHRRPLTPPPPSEVPPGGDLGGGDTSTLLLDAPPAPSLPRGPSLTAMTLSTILVGAGVLGLLDAAGVYSVSIPVFLAGALILTGGALLVGAWTGRTAGLVVTGIVLTAVLAVASTVHAPFRGGTGDRRWVPSSVEEVRRSYRLGVGDAVLDLSRVQSFTGSRTVVASVGVGHLRVVVPPRTRIVAEGHAGIGEVRLLDRHHDGWDVDNQVTDGDPEAGTLRLHLDVGLGQAEVLRSDSFRSLNPGVPSPPVPPSGEGNRGTA
jgi:phage shock protein PspC (stress-responsive transcriptional regulator)